MDESYARFAARAADQHHVLSIGQFEELGISRKVRGRWLKLGLIEPVGVHTFGVAGTGSWRRSLMAGLLDLGPHGYVAGRSAAALQHLDNFVPEPLEFLVPRELRDRKVVGRLAATTRPITAADVRRVDGIRCLRPERLILEARLFDFSRDEIEDAIDSAVRLRLMSEPRLRRRLEDERARGANHNRAVFDALVDAGGESKLERAFLCILRTAGLPRPALQVEHRREDGILVARVDTQFGTELVIEVEGHRTHSSRRQRQRDEERRTALTLRGKKVVVFTWSDVFGRPEWIVDQVGEAVSGKCA
jgi:very-short-patch-repair endonuclease